MANTDAVSFTISVEGENSKELFRGEFKAKSRLTHREQMRRDQIRRELLGGDPKFADSRAINQAEIFSQLSVRIVKAPNWWVDAQGGLDLTDDSVIVEIYTKVMRLEADALAAIQKQGEEAKKDLADLAEQK